jgi:hypothetical protein
MIGRRIGVQPQARSKGNTYLFLSTELWTHKLNLNRVLAGPPQ